MRVHFIILRVSETHKIRDKQQQMFWVDFFGRKFGKVDYKTDKFLIDGEESKMKNRWSKSNSLILRKRMLLNRIKHFSFSKQEKFENISQSSTTSTSTHIFPLLLVLLISKYIFIFRLSELKSRVREKVRNKKHTFKLFSHRWKT